MQLPANVEHSEGIKRFIVQRVTKHREQPQQLLGQFDLCLRHDVVEGFLSWNVDECWDSA